MRIGELAGRAGVSVRSLRYYEEQHLLTATRSPSGQRHYPGHAAERVQLIQQLYAAGLTSKTIRDLLPCVDVPGQAATAHSRDLLFTERERISAQIEALIRTRETLDAVIAAAGSPTCAIGTPAASAP